MRRKLAISLIVIMSIMAAGCGQQSQVKNTTVSNTQTVNDVLNQATSTQTLGPVEADAFLFDTGSEPAGNTAVSSDVNTASSATDGTFDNTLSNTDGGSLISNNEQAVSNILNNTKKTEAKVLDTSSYTDIDYDLTQMSSTLIYSEMFNMMTNAQTYVDKVIKMKGYTGLFKDGASDSTYYSCIVPDATACCANGIEFVLNDSYEKYIDYPVVNDEITVVGVFSLYKEGEYEYITLKNAELVAN